MKKTILLIIAVLTSFAAVAQPAKEIKTAMKKLAFFAGNWKGQADVSRGPAERITVSQEEMISFKLDSTILTIEGIGRNPDPKAKGAIVFNAVGTISYDPYKKEYRMRSHTLEGYYADAYFKITEANKYEWGFDLPQGKIMYEITIDPAKKVWKEEGFYSPDGSQWFPTMNMELVKQ